MAKFYIKEFEKQTFADLDSLMDYADERGLYGYDVYQVYYDGQVERIGYTSSQDGVRYYMPEDESEDELLTKIKDTLNERLGLSVYTCIDTFTLDGQSFCVLMHDERMSERTYRVDYTRGKRGSICNLKLEDEFKKYSL
jgi:hypothetical protein